MKLQQESGNVGTPWTVAVLIVLAVMSIYLFMATRATLWDRDEPRFARATVEMIESGNYLVPTFNNDLWPDKPVMFYWLMSLPIRLFGPTEFACRFFAAVGTALTCLLTFFVGQRLLGVKAGLWAMVILASTLMMLCIGTAATADAVLLPFMVAVMAVFVQAAGSKMYVSHIILMGIALGLGMLTKGPIGLFPIPVIAATLWLNKGGRAGAWRCLWQVGAALVIGGLIFIAWAIPANNETEGEFLRVFIGRHVIGRALRPMEHHGGNFLLYLPYYLPVIIAGFFPWTMHLLGTVSAVVGGRVGGKYCRALLIGWVVPIFIMMSLAATKLPHYVLFIWPALALAVAGTIVAAQQNKLSAGDRIWLRRGVWFFGPLAITGALVLMLAPWFLEIPGLRWSGLASGIVLSIMAVIAIRQQRADRPQASAKVLLIGMLVFQIPFLFGVLPAVERVKISPPIARAIKEKTAKEMPVATYKYAEPTLNFYIGRRIEPLRSEEAVIAWTRQPQPGVLIIPKDVLAAIQQRYGSLALDEIASTRGFNYSKGTILEVLALICGPKD
jgi:4-amino-4-deoxy-L-arabinose transferase-like glycosyltransferase